MPELTKNPYKFWPNKEEKLAIRGNVGPLAPKKSSFTFKFGIGAFFAPKKGKSEKRSGKFGSAAQIRSENWTWIKGAAKPIEDEMQVERVSSSRPADAHKNQSVTTFRLWATPAVVVGLLNVCARRRRTASIKLMDLGATYTENSVTRFAQTGRNEASTEWTVVVGVFGVI